MGTLGAPVSLPALPKCAPRRQGCRRCPVVPAQRRSVRIAVGVLAVPGPGGGDDVFEAGVFGFPTQLAYRLFGRGHQPRRVAGAARFLDGRNGFARHLLAHPMTSRTE